MKQEWLTLGRFVSRGRTWSGIALSALLGLLLAEDAGAAGAAGVDAAWAADEAHAEAEAAEVDQASWQSTSVRSG
jgi:hypothetical protein